MNLFNKYLESTKLYHNYPFYQFKYHIAKNDQIRNCSPQIYYTFFSEIRFEVTEQEMGENSVKMLTKIEF